MHDITRKLKTQLPVAAAIFNGASLICVLLSLAPITIIGLGAAAWFWAAVLLGSIGCATISVAVLLDSQKH